MANIKSEVPFTKVHYTQEQEIMLLATLLDDFISHIPFDAWPYVHAELAKEGWTKDYLKGLRDKYADRYRNV